MGSSQNELPVSYLCTRNLNTNSKIYKKTMVNFNFENSQERDIDRIICEELYSSQDFADIFFSKVYRDGAKVVSIFHSKKNELGETDIEVVYEYEEKRYGILIEDKITAAPQPEQAERYRLRGKKDVANGLYCEFTTFIVAPKNYLENPANEAEKYDFAISHDEIAEYFKRSRDMHSSFRLQCFESSLLKCRYNSRTMKASKAIPQFFVDYASMLEESEYDNLQIVHLPETTTKPNWVHLHSEIPGTYIMHKCMNKDKATGKPSGFIDVVFKNKPDFERLSAIINPIIERTEGLKGLAKVERIGSTQVGIRMRIKPIYNDRSLLTQGTTFADCLGHLSDIQKLTGVLKNYAL